MGRRVDKHHLGRFGESVAARFLMERGFEILARNIRVGRDELDLIAQRRGETVVVEVKCTADGTDPVGAVDEGKMQRLVRASRSLDIPIGRIDLVAVTLTPDGALVRWLMNV